MKKFIGMLKREHLFYAGYSYMLALLILFLTFLFPIGFAQYSDLYEESGIRFVMVFVSASLIVVNAIGMVITSINRDIKIKDLWMSNSQSIYALVGVKALYQFLILLIVAALNFIGFFFVAEMIEGTGLQYFVLAGTYFFILISVFVFFGVLALLFNTLHKQILVIAGKFAYLLSLVALFAFFKIISIIPDFTLLQIGHVQISNFNEYLPAINNQNYLMTGFIDFYIVEELLFTLFFVLLYLLACKWLERVMTR